MLNSHIIADLQADGTPRREEIFADCAEPKSIAEIKQAGYNIIPADKGAPVKSDKMRFQLQWMQGWALNITKDSPNVIYEARNYTWAKDRDGHTLNEPIDMFNHSLDALRYAVWTKFAKRYNYGQYNIKIV